MAASGCAARGGPAHRRAAPCAERVTRGGDRARRQAPGAQSAHATGAERVARGGASNALGGFCPAERNSNLVRRWAQDYVTSTWPSAPYYERAHARLPRGVGVGPLPASKVIKFKNQISNWCFTLQKENGLGVFDERSERKRTPSSIVVRLDGRSVCTE